jgi:hypothetical protein
VTEELPLASELVHWKPIYCHLLPKNESLRMRNKCFNPLKHGGRST